MIVATIMGSFQERDAKKLFYDLGIFILVAFVTELLKSFDEIMIVDDWMTFHCSC